jgi:transcriptional regulator with XRE-family HTH domain
VTIGERIKQARGEAGISQEALAHKAGVSLSTVTRLERNKHTGNLTTLRAVSDALEIPLGELVETAS